MRNRSAGRILVAALGLLLAACSGGASSTAAPLRTEASNRPAPSIPAPVPTTAPLPPVVAYEPLPTEPEAVIKTAAASFLEAVSTYGPGQGTGEATVARLREAGLPSVEPAQVSALLDARGEAVGEVVYPQLGGLRADQAVVIVVLRQTRRVGTGAVTSVTRSIDVRLERASSVWLVTEIASDGGEPVAMTTASPLARRVLDNPNLLLPDSARWDVAAGRIDDQLLSLIADIGEQHTLAITALQSGHPDEVFGETFTSNHTEGRGVDIWAVDGEPVLGAPEDGRAHDVAAEALFLGSTEVGSPWDLDGPGGPSLTDALHEDHLHLAFDR